jgi:deoxycytidylate deaminase
MKDRFVATYLEMAETFAKLSHASRLKVGAIIVKDDRIISLGYNGTPAGWDNTCEEVLEHYEDGGMITRTKPEVSMRRKMQSVNWQRVLSPVKDLLCSVPMLRACHVRN